DQVSTAANRGLQGGILNRLRDQARTDPAKAASLLPSITDSGFQAQGLASLATGFSSTDQARASAYLNTAQKKAEDLEVGSAKLTALAAVAEAAASLKDYALVQKELQNAFDLGEELLRQEQDMHPGESVYMSDVLQSLSGVTRLSAQFMLRPTMDRLEHIRNETLQAYL